HVFTQLTNDSSTFILSLHDALPISIEKWQEPSLHIYNVEQHRQRGEQMIMLMSVSAYGFITLITLISIANIFNTISTSISLRKRDRKSTRLNSSHVKTSYAVICFIQ